MQQLINPCCQPDSSSCALAQPTDGKQRSCLTLCRAADPKGAGDDSAKGRIQEADTPWQISFQMNERYLTWEDSAARRMLKLWVAERAGKDVAWVEDRLNQLVVLLPDMLLRLERIKADIVLQLVQDPQAIANKLVALRKVLPHCDLSKLVSRFPALLLEMEPEAVSAQMSNLRLIVPDGTDVEALIETEPALLCADLNKVVMDLRRLLPKAIPGTVIASNPTMVLDMAAHRMESSEEKMAS